MGHRSNRGGDIPTRLLGNQPGEQIGTSPANAIRASRKSSLHKQAECKTASPLKLHAAQSCFPWDDHVSAWARNRQSSYRLISPAPSELKRLASNHPLHHEHDNCYKYKYSHQANNDEVKRIQILDVFLISSSGTQANERPGNRLDSTPESRFSGRCFRHFHPSAFLPDDIFYATAL